MEKLPNHLFEYNNHTNDNSIVRFFISGSLIDLIVGYCEQPYYLPYRGYGLMFYTKDHKKVWCHISDLIFEHLNEMEESK